jgi:hypothetical protein
MPSDLALALTDDFSDAPHIQPINQIAVRGISPQSDSNEYDYLDVDDNDEMEVEQSNEANASGTVGHRTDGDRTLAPGDASLAVTAKPITKINLHFPVKDAYISQSVTMRICLKSTSGILL